MGRPLDDPEPVEAPPPAIAEEPDGTPVENPPGHVGTRPMDGLA